MGEELDMCRVTAVLCVGLVCACGGVDELEPPDGATLTDAGSISDPEIPWLADGTPPVAPPELTPCPDGWREIRSGDAPTTCDPYPAGGALECPEGQAHFPGEPDCTPVGSPCPIGDFSDALPSDRAIVYVRQGATGGDGSESRPYGSLAEFSITRLPAGAVLALSGGTYMGHLTLSRGLTVWGACAAQTILTASDRSETAGTITVRNSSAEARDLTVAGGPRDGILLSGAGAEGVLDGVVVRSAESMAVTANLDAQLTARSVLLVGTRARGRDAEFGRALNLEFGATADVTRAIMGQNRDTTVFGKDEGTHLSLVDVVIRDTQSRLRDGGQGLGVEINGGATADVARALIANNRYYGFFTADAGTGLTLRDSIVELTQNRQIDSARGRGLQVQQGATAEIERVLFDRNRDTSLIAIETGVTLEMADVVVRDTQIQDSDAKGGNGVRIMLGATASLSRVLFERSSMMSVYLLGRGTTATFEDLIIRDTAPQVLDQDFGFGLLVHRDASASVRRALVDRSHYGGVYAAVDGMLTVEDALIRQTRSRVINGLYGRGLGAQQGATVEVNRTVIEDSHEIGASSEGSSVTVADVVVRGVRPRDCPATAPECNEYPVGHGVAAYNDGSLTMTRFLVSEATGCGLHITELETRLSDGAVSGSSIGACVQVEGYDLVALSDEVRFSDNETDLQTTSLPIPESAEIGLE